MKTIGSHSIGVLLCFLIFTAGIKAQSMRSVSLIQASTPRYPPCSFQRESPSPSVFTKNNYRTASTIGETTSGNTLIRLTADDIHTRSITVRKNTHVRIVGSKANGSKPRIVDARSEDGRRLRSGDAYDKPVSIRDVFFRQSDGSHLQLARTGFFRIEHLEKTDGKRDSKIYRIELPDDFVKQYIKKKNTRLDTDNVFISYGWWFYRNTGKVIGFTRRGRHYYVDYEWDGWYYAPDQAGQQWRKDNYFFLSNFGPFGTQADGDGVKVKNRRIWFKGGATITKSKTDEPLITIEPGGTLELDNVDISGEGRRCIMNKGELVMRHTAISNTTGQAIELNGPHSRIFVDDCDFHDIKDYGIETDSECAYLEVTNSRFTNIGHYGANAFAVLSKRKGYIADNTFTDINYGAIFVGDVKPTCSQHLVENNIVRQTSDWKPWQRVLGLKDSGAIYIATNNCEAVVRYNKVLNFGGTGGNHAIYADDGAYNVQIYANVVADTESGYDIYSRYVPEGGSGGRQVLKGLHANMNNYIAYNVCNGYLWLEWNRDLRERSNCTFKSNVQVRRTTKNSFTPPSSEVNTTDGKLLLSDPWGNIDEQGDVVSSQDYFKAWTQTKIDKR